MRQLLDSTYIDAPPTEVWSWLEGLADHYRQWHGGHVSARWTKGAPNQVGSVLEVVEDIGGHREKLAFEITAVEPAHRLRYRIRGAHGLLLPGGAFELAPSNGGTDFVASLDVRFAAIAERLLKRRVAALRAHLHEEGENLKRLLEA